jgi:RND family efflux transporter MFP subunit
MKPNSPSFSWCRPHRGAFRFRPGAVLIAGGWLALTSFSHGAAAESVAMVAVAPVTRRDLAKDLSVQAELRPAQEIDLHAKVAGYLRRIDVDIGDHVKAGDPIATLEVPELREDLAKSQAALLRAESNYKEAHLNYTRLVSVSKGQPNLLAQQEVDVAQAKDASAAAAVTEAKSDVDKYRTLEDYTRIRAPFDGVITKRFADPGALIQAGTASNAQPLVRLSQNDKLRLVFPISVSYARAFKVGDPLEIDLGEKQDRLSGTIARFNRRIATDTRTMLAEADVPNANLELIPGMYATVVLTVDRHPQTLAVPVEAVSGSKQPTVYVVTADKKIEERAIQLGIETPTRYEVTAGLREGELVMIGNRAQVHVGQTVTTKMVSLVAGQ